MGFDRLYNFLTRGSFDKDSGSRYWTKEIVDKGGSSDVWVCFLGWRSSIALARRMNLLPKKGKIIVYQEPNALVNKNPNEAKKLFLELYKDVEKHLKSGANVLSISLGNLHGFYVSSNYKIERFVSLLPGPELGRNIWKSCATRDIREEAEVLNFTQKKYDRILEAFECDHNCSRLPKNSVFYIARKDDYIPTEDQMDLVEKIKKSHNYKKISYFNLGHIFSHVYFGLLNTFGKIPWDD